MNVEIVDVRSVLDGLPGSVDLVKADCEGAECEILMALTRDHAEKIRQIIIEPTPKLYDIQKLLAHMRLVGYSQHSQQGLFLFSRA